ncbi:MAG: type II toxin-antitoxin system HicB family antitoxin [Cyanobacteria bacterium P01_G01_bin.54]
MESGNKAIYNQTVLLEKEEDGGYHAFCPVLKGCHSQEDSFEEAIANMTAESISKVQGQWLYWLRFCRGTTLNDLQASALKKMASKI